MKTILSALILLLGVAAVQPQEPRSRQPQSPEPRPTAQEPRAVTKPQKITTFLWFDDKAEEAIRFYLSVFADGRILDMTRWGEGGPVPAGTLMTARFTLCGQEFIALNGGPMFHFNEAISLFVNCSDQREVDTLWARLCEGGGAPGHCGWLKDKYGLSWQIVPSVLVDLLHDKDAAKAARVSAAMMQMGKIDIAALQRAHAGK